VRPQPRPGPTRGPAGAEAREAPTCLTVCCLASRLHLDQPCPCWHVFGKSSPSCRPAPTTPFRPLCSGRRAHNANQLLSLSASLCLPSVCPLFFRHGGRRYLPKRHPSLVSARSSEASSHCGWSDGGEGGASAGGGGGRREGASTCGEREGGCQQQQQPEHGQQVPRRPRCARDEAVGRS
jgi:hypothetical protein